VAIGGYTLGGGHSPISRMYGLAVDNLLEVEMVTADAKFVVANDNGTKIVDINGTL
jgi:FAD/FMN-containing dehydrogenase